jgi:hypothetical protein
MQVLQVVNDGFPLPARNLGFEAIVLKNPPVDAGEGAGGGRGRGGSGKPLSPVGGCSPVSVAVEGQLQGTHDSVRVVRDARTP